MIYIQKILIKNYPVRDKIFLENIVSQARCPFRDNILIFSVFEYISTVNTDLEYYYVTDIDNGGNFKQCT